MRAARRARDRVWTAAPALLALLALSAACSTAGEGARPITHVVEMKGFGFRPDSVEVAVGDTLVWKNEDIVPHAVAGSDLESGSIAPDSSWRYVVRARGTVPYICPFHPTMKGMLMVR
jgi:plastocyanin